MIISTAFKLIAKTSKEPSYNHNGEAFCTQLYFGFVSSLDVFTRKKCVSTSLKGAIVA